MALTWKELAPFYGQGMGDLPQHDPSCLDCVRKHLSQAAVCMDEARQGYPQHRWLAIGHLAEAARECCVRYPAFAAKLREHRHALQKDPGHLVPFLDLIAEAGRAG